MSKIRIDGERNPSIEKPIEVFFDYTKNYNDNAANRTEKDFCDF